MGNLLGGLLGGQQTPSINRSSSQQVPAGVAQALGQQQLQQQGPMPQGGGGGLLDRIDPRLVLAGLGMMMDSRPGPRSTMGLQGALQGLQAGQGMHQRRQEQSQQRQRQQALQGLAQQFGGGQQGMPGQAPGLGGIAAQLAGVPGMENAALQMMMQSRQPPETRQLRQGNSYVTQEWNPQTQSWSDVASSPIRTGGGGGGGSVYERILAQVQAENPELSTLEAWERVRGQQEEENWLERRVRENAMQRMQEEQGQGQAQSPEEDDRGEYRGWDWFERNLNPWAEPIEQEQQGPQAQQMSGQVPQGRPGFLDMAMQTMNPVGPAAAAEPTQDVPPMTEAGVPDLALAEIFGLDDLTQHGYTREELPRLFRRAVTRYPRMADQIRGMARRQYGISIP